MRSAIAIVCLSACGGSPREASRPIETPALAPVDAGGHLNDPDLNRTPVKLLAIDWSATKLDSQADVLALWQQIAPTGEDWAEKLEEIPDEGPIAAQLALAMLAGGNFTCVQPQPVRDCVRPPLDVPDPAPGATLVDPCLRRLLALWSLGQLEPDQLASMRDALRTIAAIPPPESQLVAEALRALPDTDHAGRLELLAIAFRAGHRDLVNGSMGTLDEAHAIEAVQKHKIDGALDVLSTETHRPVFRAAIADEQLHPAARIQAIVETVTSEDTLSRETRAALLKATKSADCGVSASAARALVQRGDKKLGPARPRTKKPAAMMRSLCVLASYEALQQADEPSYLLGYVPAKGLELVKVAYDEYSDTDDDGDGNPNTTTTATIVPRDELVLPEIEDMIRAFERCTGTTCTSEDREFRFSFKPQGGELVLTRLEVVERPPCNKRAIPVP